MSAVSPFETQLSNIRKGLSAVELVYTSHNRWPLPHTRRPVTHSQPESSHSHLNISVLDSSFNPPTLAHLALANTSYPSTFRMSPSSPHGPQGPPSPSLSPTPSDSFHAKLLLLSVRNADKLLKPSDVTYAQRLDMMVLLSKSITPDFSCNSPSPNEDTTSTESPSESHPNVAVAIIDEPTFVGKSRILLDYLRNRIADQAIDSNSLIDAKLTFLVGMDTLDRLFSSRYYSSEDEMQRVLRNFLSSDGDDSRVICARRMTPGQQAEEQGRESRTLSAATQFLNSNRVVVIDLDPGVEDFSSSEVRNHINDARSDLLWSSMLHPAVARYIAENRLYKYLAVVS